MSEPSFRALLSMFTPADAEGVRTFACPCGMTHRLRLRDVVYGPGALGRSASMLRDLYGAGVKLWVLSDGNTEAAAGKDWKSAVQAGRIASRILPAEPWPVPTMELAQELSAEVRAAAPDLLVSVGSGVISDLVKKVSLDTGLPNWAVATAPSVDAYSSATSAIRVKGYHEPLPTGISEVIVCDRDVTARAPQELFLSGLGDLLAKIIAHFDWNLAKLVTGEYYCPTCAELSLASARAAIGAARREREDHAEAAWTLMDACLASGFLMQALGGSRSAASAEHTIAHFWEMAGAVGVRRWDLHGILVGSACRIVHDAYAAILDRFAAWKPDGEARCAAYRREPSWEASLAPGLKPFAAKIRQEVELRGFSERMLMDRLGRAAASRERILPMAKAMLKELGEAVSLLDSLDYPLALDELRIREDCREWPVRNVRLLRNRYTLFDLMYETGLDGEVLADCPAARW